MSLDLDRCDVFVRGHFNPHILSPEWLAEQSVWKPDEVQLGLGFLRQGLQFRSKQVEWLIDTEGMVISSLQEDCSDLGDLAARVMEKLPHTPISAVGNNFNYVGKVEDWSRSPLEAISKVYDVSFGGEFTLDESKWTGTFRHKSVQIGITVAFGPDGDSVFFNFHRPTNKSPEAAIQAAREFCADRELSKQLLSTLLGVE